MKFQSDTTGFKVLFAGLVILAMALPQTKLFAQSKAGTDTLFKKLSTEELLKIKKYYKSKVENLRKAEDTYRQEGMDWSENFLKEKGQNVSNRDNIYIRLAEYYIEEAEKEYEAAVEAYDEKYSQYEKELEKFDNKEIDVEPVAPEFPKYDYSKALGVYDRILEEYPASNYADDALYGKAWLLEKMGKGAQSRRIYREVIDKYPDSPFAPESYMRLAEYYFSPRADKTDEEQSVLEIRKAIQLYKNVLKYKNSQRYDEALYKLGWSYYKLAAHDPKLYNDAITYFLMVVDDVERAKKYDPKNKITNPNVRDEAVEYIGISFTDEAYTTAGVDKARHLLERIGDRPYGPEIMEAIGNTFSKIDEQKKAIYAYQNLLEMYPDFVRAPEIQQNIVKALFALGKDQEAYAARDTLYTRYRPNSKWYQTIENSSNPDKVKYLAAAYKYSEGALRTNLLLDLEKAEDLANSKKDATPAYEKVGNLCRIYLDTFPADSNAYDVNWSYALLLDSRLGKFEDAFNEYIRVSNDYMETAHQEDAAINAVGVADTLVKIKYGSKDSISVDLANVAKLNPEALSPEESRLIEAYDNYIRLFPNGEYTANFLAAAGGIYYNHKKFAEAKVYFQTLVKRFPGSEEKSLAMRSIMDSYFALGRFKDSEIIAKKIMDTPSVSDKQKEFARKRLGQAIFKNAEYLEEQGDFFNAATEYFRVFQEAKDEPKLVERALFNSGLSFQKSKDWIRAISTYDTLVTNYPKSKFAIPALHNMADDYQELEQYTNAASTYERIFNEFRNSDEADVALYNAAYYYKKGKDWKNAIRVNNLYIQNYPKQEYAVDLFFANADMYLKLDNVTEANRIYQEFAQKYPNDPRTVTAFYERGKYYMDNGQMNLAKREFEKALSRSESFKKKGQDPNPFVAGEAVNALAEILHNEYASIELKQPASAIKQNLNKMRSLMKQLNQTYAKVLGYGSPRSFEAVYNTARTYEEFANKFSHQEIDPALNPTKRFVELKKINEQAAGLYDKAVEQYKQVIDNIPLIAEKLGVDMNAPDTVVTFQVDTLEANDSVRVAQKMKRVAEVDSSKALAKKYFAKAKDKISELLYTEASLTSENVMQAISIQPPQKDPVQRIIFKRAILAKAAAPAIKQTIDAHLRNIHEAEVLGLSNKYVEESKRQIVLTSNIMASELEDIAYSTFAEYERQEKILEDLIEKDFGAKTAKGLDYYGVDNDISQLIDYIKILSNDILKSYENTLELAKSNNIQNDLVKNTQERMLRYVVEMSDKMSETSQYAKDKSSYYQTRFDSTQNYNYDDAAGFFENYLYAFSDNSKEIMDTAFQLQQDYNIHNLWANKLLFKLIKIDPEAYSAGIEKEKIEIYTDEDWKYSTTYFKEAWTKPEFDDSGWNYAQTVLSDTNQFAALGVNPKAIWIIKTPVMATPDTLADSLSVGDSLMTSDTLAVAMNDSALNTAGQASADTLVFFRKSFDINGTPLSGALYITADEDFRIYLNGEYLLDDELNNYNVIDSLDYYTFDIYLKKGKNELAIDVEDKDLTGQGLKMYGYFEVLPADITSAAEEKAKVKQVFVEPNILRRVNILNKNRISLSKGNQ